MQSLSLCFIHAADALKETVLPPASETKYFHFKESSFSSFGGGGKEALVRGRTLLLRLQKKSRFLLIMSPVCKDRFLNLQEYHIFFLKMTHIDSVPVSQTLCLHGSYLPLGLHYSLRDGIGVKEVSCSFYQSGYNQRLGFF